MYQPTGNMGTVILGSGRYRWQIIIRSPDPLRLLADFPVPRPWLVDIDPVSTL